ncbi:YggT family protein [Aureimonas fodinaquatilis]|uniref:YggT family protein n=1 Tax=Aureimonas fodinaquatilis TaxID=2565783 RepID=A0A5B0DVU5_9HYPH|nr:YggT family protein [Aureimonas fodinaquatilis]KAA0969690.1 YggT family protein [Aureimonas fodinaquatilis]
MVAVINLVLLILNIVWWVVIASAILSWLFAFNIVNMRNSFVAKIAEVLYRLTEPLYRPIRRILPDLGGLDLSPLIVLLGIYFLQQFIVYSVAPVLLGY